MTTILTIDIGGSKCEAALWQSSCTQPRLLQKIRFASDLPDETAIIAQIKPLPDDLEAAVIAIAGRISNSDEADEIRLTNNPCTISIPRLKAALPAACRLSVLNDLEALAHAIPYLPPASCIDINPHADFARLYSPSPRLAAAVGTGFGAAALLPGGRVLPTEAGHMRFAPADAAQADLLQQIARQTATNPHSITNEELLSGVGLCRIHRALGWQDATPQDITQAAANGDAAAAHTISVFCGALGAALGNLALAHLPGAVYLAGGVLQHLAPHMDADALMQGLCVPGPFADYLAGLPLMLITDEAPTLLGAVMYAERFLLG